CSSDLKAWRDGFFETFGSSRPRPRDVQRRRSALQPGASLAGMLRTPATAQRPSMHRSTHSSAAPQVSRIRVLANIVVAQLLLGVAAAQSNAWVTRIPGGRPRAPAMAYDAEIGRAHV